MLPTSIRRGMDMRTDEESPPSPETLLKVAKAEETEKGRAQL